MRWTEQSLDFDVDVRAHVFELTIRSLGGLLSAHSLLVRDASLVPGQPQNACFVPEACSSLLVNNCRASCGGLLSFSLQTSHRLRVSQIPPHEVSSSTQHTGSV